MDTINAFKYIFNILLSKKICISLGLSSLITILLDRLIAYFDMTKNLVEYKILVSLFILTNIFVFIDFILGIFASKSRKEVISSKKWGQTVSKILGIVLYMSFGLTLLYITKFDNNIFVIINTGIILTIFKEYISIGENIEAVFEKKPYIFYLVDKIFELVEDKFFNFFKKVNNGRGNK